MELEHGKKDSGPNVTQDDKVFTGKIALAHLNEFPDYYTRLQKMETEAGEDTIKLKNEGKCGIEIVYNNPYSSAKECCSPSVLINLAANKSDFEMSRSMLIRKIGTYHVYLF